MTKGTVKRWNLIVAKLNGETATSVDWYKNIECKILEKTEVGTHVQNDIFVVRVYSYSSNRASFAAEKAFKASRAQVYSLNFASTTTCNNSSLKSNSPVWLWEPALPALLKELC